MYGELDDVFSVHCQNPRSTCTNQILMWYQSCDLKPHSGCGVVT